MKASQVKSEPTIFFVPEERKGGVCRFCEQDVADYRGIRVGENVYCNWRCFHNQYKPKGIVIGE